MYDFAEYRTGSLKRLRKEDRIGATHALLVPPFIVYVSLDEPMGSFAYGAFAGTCAEPSAPSAVTTK